MKIRGTGFTAPAFVELTTGIIGYALPAASVTPTEIEVVVPPLPAAVYDLRVGLAPLVPPFVGVPGPSLRFEVTATPQTAGPEKLRYARYGHEAVALPSGEVLVVGGSGRPTPRSRSSSATTRSR